MGVHSVHIGITAHIEICGSGREIGGRPSEHTSLVALIIAGCVIVVAGCRAICQQRRLQMRASFIDQHDAIIARRSARSAVIRVGEVVEFYTPPLLWLVTCSQGGGILRSVRASSAAHILRATAENRLYPEADGAIVGVHWR